MTGLEVCFANKTNIVSCHTGDFKPVKQEVNGTVILPPSVFHGERELTCTVRVLHALDHFTQV